MNIMKIAAKYKVLIIISLIMSLMLLSLTVTSNAYSQEINNIDNDLSSCKYNSVNNYHGSMIINKDGNILPFDCKWGLNILTDDDTAYNNDLSKISCLLSNSAYYKANTSAALAGCIAKFDNPDFNTENPDIDIYKNLGFQDVKRIHIGNNNQYETRDITDIYLAYAQTVKDNGQTVGCYICTVRGTDGTFNEWYSNTDIGCTTNDYWEKDAPHWKNKRNHKGFDVTAELVMDELMTFVWEHSYNGNNNPENNYMLITGHSRGGAIANLVSSKVIDEKENKEGVFSNFVTKAYTFATPNTVESRGLTDTITNYPQIFNIINKDDMVPQMPFKEWGFQRYGLDVISSINNDNLLKSQYKLITNNNYTCASEENLSELKTIVSKLATNRNELYVCPESGTEVYKLFWTLENDYNNIMNSDYGKFCKIDTDKSWIIDAHITVHPSPAFCLVYLAHLCSEGKDYFIRSFVKQDTEIRFWGNYKKFVYFFVLGGENVMSMPHIPVAYYMMINN